MVRISVLTAGVLTALLAVGLAAAREGGRSGPAPVAQPGEPVFVIKGRGWGHGVGMSQWGAHGFARRGVGYRRILAHYYQGTTVADAPVAQVRVLLATGKRSLTISSRAAFRVRDAAGRVRPLAAGQHTFGPGLKLKPKRARRKVALRAPVTFLPGAEPLTLERRYRGTIQVDVVGGRLRAINFVGLEPYLSGVVPAEVPDDWPAEVLKAQAVVARSYALATRKTGGAFDLFPDTRSQVYRGVDEEEETTTAAVEETAGEVLTHRGRVATTYYHSTSGGRTASIADVWPGSRPTPYLVAVADPHDSISPHHTWGPVVVPSARLSRLLGAPGRLVDVRTTLNGSGRAAALVGVGTLGQASKPANDVRRELGLRSTWFRVGVLGLSRPAQPHVFGTTSRLTGLARNVGTAVLELRGPSGWRGVATVRAGADGSFSVAVRPTTSSDYRLAAGSARTATTRLGVAPRVRLSPITAPMEIRGTVLPVVSGAAVEIQRLNGGGWTTVGRTAVEAQGEFAARIHVPPGRYRARVPTPGRGLVAGTSPTLVVAG